MTRSGITLKTCLTCAALLCGTAGAATGGWKSDWSEEFDGPIVDASVWGYEIGNLRNNEAQYYSDRPENSRIDSGSLLIQALRDGWNGHAYTSASRTTRGKKTWKYGRFEMRARIDIRAGSWPAWWWLPSSGGWPRGGEIDMMEFYQGKCLFNVMDGNGKWTSPTRSITSLGGPRWAREFHTWTMEWDSLRIDLSLDGTLINHYDLPQADGTGPNGGNPFRRSGYMILNQAIGGNSGGNPSATSFPVDFRVDWIRVHTWDPAAASAPVTVAGGAGSGTYAVGSRASLTAGLPPEGQVFDHWQIDGDADPEAAGSPSTRIVVPEGGVRATAIWKPQGAILIRAEATGSRLSILPGAGWFDLSGRHAPPYDPKSDRSGARSVRFCLDCR